MTETGIVALVGAGTTALVAIVGFVVNARLARSAARRDEARRRYDELMKLYEGVGEAMNSMYLGLHQVISSGEPETDEAAGELIDRVFGELMRPLTATHRAKMLLLYGASERVRSIYDAYDQQVRYIATGEVDAIVQGGGAVAMERIRTLIDEFYEAAGEDARARLSNLRDAPI